MDEVGSKKGVSGRDAQVPKGVSGFCSSIWAWALHRSLPIAGIWRCVGAEDRSHIHRGNFITCQEKIPRPKAEKAKTDPGAYLQKGAYQSRRGVWQHVGKYLLSAVGCFVCERSPARPNYGAAVATKSKKTGRSSGSIRFCATQAAGPQTKTTLG